MDRRKKPHPGWPCGCSCAPSCCDQGYIVEKVIANRHGKTCFEGVITLCGLAAHLRPPLTLCRVEVIRIRPLRPDPCGCGEGSGRLCLTLLCCVVDSCGCRGEGTAEIDVEDCPVRCTECGANIRRGAQVELLHACFCAPCAFRVCLSICLHTVASRCELVSARPQACNPCPTLPLYPPPCGHHCCS